MTRIQDDLFATVNAEWLENTEIPADKPRISAFDELVLKNEKNLLPFTAAGDRQSRDASLTGGCTGRCRRRAPSGRGKAAACKAGAGCFPAKKRTAGAGKCECRVL